ncbi:hypothetical protein PVK06_004963 [Gossypium arboreum]|uniref:Uncharacterized protein n=1 Tax=Gossypium arboreum TaxID=29729 RepID=A0ABR0QUL9_GOSAR|nr:hypothetical protein PVK06_004963 [Gossypium arboreum]
MLYHFVNHPIEVKGSITLLDTLGDGEHTTTEYVQFYVVDHPMAYNAIFRRLIMRMEMMTIAIFCMKIKFSTKTGVGFLRFDQCSAGQCHMLSVKIIGHTIQKCKKNEEVSDSNNLGLQYGNWLRALPMNPNQNRGIWRNGIEMVSTQSITNDTIEESKLDTREEDTKNAQKGKGKKYVEDSMSNSPMEKRITKLACDRPRRFKCKRKRQKSIPGDNTNESPSKIAWRRLVDNMSPCKAEAGDRPRQEQ